ncbi:MAG: nicotinate-nucleotide adenylyltransferase [Gammaproteobacteria bacterium]|nr:nicotinate-nucleotide adenylyltransferase [Gammaproteobacteria bacterium]
MIGVFGGTFDPVHFGHLRPALEVLQGLQLQEIRWIPCHQPPHREMPVADSSLRVEMLEIAIKNVDGMHVDTREIEREGPSYMVDTLKSLREEAGDTPLCLLMGMDAFCGLDRWHKWQEIMELSHLIVMQRPDSNEPETGELAELLSRHKCENIEQIVSEKAGRILFYQVTQMDISASQIRKTLREGKSLRYLMPDKVIDIIEREGLYV